MLKRLNKDMEPLEDVKRRKVNGEDVLCKLPMELFHMVIDFLSRKDIITISSLSHKHRALVFGYLFEEAKVDWTQINEFVKGFKHLRNIRKLAIDSKVNDLKLTSKCEWNVSFKPMLETMTNLEELSIELVTSSRCLKYKDDIDEDLSSKIKKIKLRSKAITNSGDVNGEAMFELSQLQKFHDVEKLSLNGFSLNRDIYFLPTIKEDLSDSLIRKRDGKMNHLKEIELVNCQWEYPITLKDVFSPEYPLPSGVKPSLNCSPNKISLKFTNESSKFVESERFKMFVNNEYNRNFQFEVEFFQNLTDLELIVENDNYQDNKFRYYYPRLNLLDLKRVFYTEEGGKQCILSNLRRLRLIGWHLLSGLELERCFKLDKGFKHQMEYIELLIVSRGDPQDVEFEFIMDFTTRLQLLFGDKCHVVVGFIH